MVIRVAQCNMVWWEAYIRRGDYYGQDEPCDRPRGTRPCYQDAWVSTRRIRSADNTVYVEIFRMEEVNGSFESRRCYFRPRWEDVRHSNTAYSVLQKILKEEYYGENHERENS